MYTYIYKCTYACILSLSIYIFTHTHTLVYVYKVVGARKIDAAYLAQGGVCMLKYADVF